MAIAAPRLHHVRAGSGPPLVLIHGLGGSLVNWEPVLPLLTGERDVIAVDMPGFGESEALRNGTAHSPAAMGRAIAAYLAELGVERPHLAGNSLGGWVALEMAADGLAASVCAVSPAGLWRAALGPRAFDLRGAARRAKPLIHAVLRTGPGRRALLRTTVARPERFDATEASRWIGAWLDAPAYEDANRMMRELVFDRADEVRVPTVIAWGAADRLLRPPRPERMPAAARYLEVPGWGHTPTLDDPHGVARLLLEASARSAPRAGETSGAA